MRRAGAAGNFLAPIQDLSLNAFKAVIDIDLIGSWITVKATLPHLLKSAEIHRNDGKSSKQYTLYPMENLDPNRVVFLV